MVSRGASCASPPVPGATDPDERTISEIHGPRTAAITAANSVSTLASITDRMGLNGVSRSTRPGRRNRCESEAFASVTGGLRPPERNARLQSPVAQPIASGRKPNGIRVASGGHLVSRLEL